MSDVTCHISDLKMKKIFILHNMHLDLKIYHYSSFVFKSYLKLYTTKLT